MATQKTLYLTTDGIYHTNEELASEAQERLNSTGGKSEAIEDLDAFISQATTKGDSKYWRELSAQAISTTSKFRSTDGVDMFRDIFNKDFDSIVALALSIAAHMYTLPVSVDWQVEDDKAKAHLSGDNFNYSLDINGMLYLLVWNEEGFLHTNSIDAKQNYSITTEVSENTFGFRAGTDGTGELLATFKYIAETESFASWVFKEDTYKLSFTPKPTGPKAMAAVTINAKIG